MSSALVIKELHVAYGDTLVFHNLDLSLPPDFVAILGPNGSGKTTLLLAASGVLDAQQPDLEVGGEVLIAGEPPQSCIVGMVFQDYRQSLFPWRTAARNISLPWEIGAVREAGGRPLAPEAVVRQFGMDAVIDPAEDLGKPVYQLSGGQQQLVAIARALAMEPDLLVMDEPLSALDAEMRLKIENCLLEIKEHRRKSFPILFVSHDVEEAVYLADLVLVLMGKHPVKEARQVSVDLAISERQSRSPRFRDKVEEVRSVFHEAITM